MKDRYFVNEKVEAILRSKWYPAQVLRVIPPTSLELEQYKQEPDQELSTEDKLLMLEQYGPPPELFKYEVREVYDDELDGGPNHVVILINFLLWGGGLIIHNYPHFIYRSPSIAFGEKRDSTLVKKCDSIYVIA